MQRKDFQPSLEVAISVLAEKDVGAIQKLKDFLQSLPNPKQVEKTLVEAVLHLAQQDLESFNWLIEHQAVLSPELNLTDFTRRLAVKRLRASATATADPSVRGWMQDKDVIVHPKAVWTLSRPVLEALTACLSPAELRLVKAILPIDPVSSD